jgi:leucyl-tRNA synthetase
VLLQEQQEKNPLQYRLTAETEVNWCPGLGTVLANDEIVNGVSERGGFTVVQKKHNGACVFQLMRNVCLQGLNDIDWVKVSRGSQQIGLESIGLWLVFQLCQ